MSAPYQFDDRPSNSYACRFEMDEVTAAWPRFAIAADGEIQALENSDGRKFPKAVRSSRALSR